MNPLPTAWRWPLLIWGLLLLLLLATQWPASSGMAQIWWHNDTFAHGMLVPLLSIWLVWRERERLAVLAPQPWWPGLLLLVLAVLVGQGAWLAEINALQHFGVVFALQAMTLALLGPTVVRAIVFPLLFLLFAPPFGEFLTQPMMEFTADFTVSALRGSGIPVYREGMHFVIPSGHWSVIEACSGVRYLMASFMVGTLFAYVNFTSWRKRLLFMAVALLVPVVANWLRAYLIVMLGHLTDNKLAAGADHLVYGWVFFGVIMVAMFWIGARWIDPLPPPFSAVNSPQAASRPISHWLPVLLLLAVALLLPQRWALSLRVPPAPSPAPAMAQAIPESWQRVDRAAPWQPVFVGAHSTLREAWQRDGEVEPVFVDIGYYPTQGSTAKTVNSMNQLFESMDRRWLPQGREALQAPHAAVQQQSWRYNAQGITPPQDLLSRRLYWVGGRFTANEVQAKWWLLSGLVLGQGDAGASLVLLTSAQGDGTARLDALQKSLLAPLNARLQAGP